MCKIIYLCLYHFHYMEFHNLMNNRNLCFTASFNERDELLHWYFDIAKKTDVDERGVPYIEDLYLDIMYYKSGRYEFLDEDELREALEEKKITQKEYDLAYRVAHKVIDSLDGNVDKLIKFTYKYYDLVRGVKTKDDGDRNGR